MFRTSRPIRTARSERVHGRIGKQLRNLLICEAANST
jgi:hypothetical protein